MILKNIIIYRDITYEQNYNKKDMYKGSIILQNDGYFEGIVKSENPDTEHFIFGIIYQNKFVLMYKLSARISEVPSRIEAKLESNNSFEGNISEIELFGEIVCGNCKINIMDRKFGTMERVNETFLDKKIHNFKIYTLDKLSLDFYQAKLSEIRLLSVDDLENMAFECNPVNKNLMNSNTYYKLTRKVTNIFEPKNFK